MKPTDEQVIALTKELTDQGRLIEAGFVGLRAMAISPTASAAQVADMRMAFMAGAAHLFASIVSVLEPGEEPTEADMARMDKIHDELERFNEELKLLAAGKGEFWDTPEPQPSEKE